MVLDRRKKWTLENIAGQSHHKSSKSEQNRMLLCALICDRPFQMKKLYDQHLQRPFLKWISFWAEEPGRCDDTQSPCPKNLFVASHPSHPSLHRSGWH